MDETDAQVQEAEAALARAREESAAKRRKTNTSECDASARAQAELDKAVDDASHAVLGGKPHVGRSATQSAQQAKRRAEVSDPLSQHFPGARRPRGFCGVLRWDACRRVALAEHHLGADSISKVDMPWQQSGFRGTAAPAKHSENSTKGTSGVTIIATRNHVALAAWSMEKSDVCGRSGFDWSAQLVRLRGSTVLLVMVYMTMRLAG